MTPSPLIHCGTTFLWTVMIQFHDKPSTAQIQMDQTEVRYRIYRYMSLSCQRLAALTYLGTSRTMATALGSMTEDMRSMSEAPLQPSTLVPMFVPQSASNRITPCFDDHTYDEVDFTYNLDSHQARRSTPTLSLLNNYLDHGPTVLSGLRSTAGPHSIETDWNHE
jgi:hypothetical protein